MVRETRHLWVSNQPEIVREERIRDHFKRSSEDVSPQSFEQRGSTYYDRTSRLNEPDQYIRRSNNFHPSDLRGRTRERVYRNGPIPYPSSIAERSLSGGHHRVSAWYDTGSSSISTISGPGSSPATRSVYGNVASAVVQPDTTSLYDSQVLKTKNSKKSRSGSESPCGGGSSSVNATSSHSSSHIERGNGGSAASSRSHSRSPSSCSSTNSTSSNSHASSPVSGSDPPLSSTSSTTSRSRNLQSAVSAPNQTGNLVVHSEDNRPLAICVKNLPARSSDTSLKDGLFHEYKKHGKVTWVKVVGQNAERYALVCFKKPEDVEKALEVSQDKLFFGCKIEVEPYQGYDVEDNEFRPYEAELDEYHPKATRTLFIGNLEKDITGSTIRSHFECFGEIIEIDIKKQGMNAYAFCQYSDIVSVVKAMRKMDGEHLGSNRIKLGFGKSMPTNCVWIDGIADSVSENYLMVTFKSYGPITEVVIDRDRKLALVSFEQVQYAQLAVKEMRGTTLRGRKLQVDFASRECREKFCSKVEKQTAGSRFSSRYGCSSSSGGTGGATGNTDLVSTSQSRSRASSFSRHSNLNCTSTGSVGGTSPTGSTSGCGASASAVAAAPLQTNATTGSSSSCASGSSAGAGGTTPRGSRSSRGLRHSEYDYTEQRIRSYDEFSQGSGASHDDESYNYTNTCIRPDSPQSRLGVSALDTLEVSGATIGRRRCEKSPGDIRNLQKERFQILEQLEECPSSGDELVSPKKRMKFDHSSHHHNHHHTISSLTQPVQLSSQLTSSSTSSSAPSGALASCLTTGSHECNTNNNTSSNNASSSLQSANSLIGDSNCDVYSNHSNVTSCSLHHRKCVEVRRLSECSLSLKYASQLSSSSGATATTGASAPSVRRASTEISGGGASGSTSTNLFVPASVVGGSSSASRHGSTSSLGPQESSSTAYVAPHSVPCKRRRTGASCIVGTTTTSLPNSTSNDSNEHHSSRGRGHQLHSHHSHEASGGESADGSRPGTPLCDERPEVSLSEPRRIPRDRPHEPMVLPLPKFGIQFFQQHRLAASSVGGVGLGGQSATCGSASTLHTGQLYSSSLINSSSSTNSSSINNNSGLLNNSSSSSTLLNSNNGNHSSLSSTLSSPPPALAGAARLSAPSLHHHHHHHHHSSNHSTGSNSSSSSLSHHTPHHHHHQQHHTGHHQTSGSVHSSGEQPPSSPLRPRSLSSNSSDSDGAPTSSSPSIEERLKTLDEMYEIWSGGGGGNVSRPHNMFSDAALQSRHRFLELDVNEVKPSEFVKRVLAKKSIFDDDLKRLKNISDKYDPTDFSNVARSALVSTSPGIPNLAATKTPVVGGNPAAKQNSAQSTVFHSPSVNTLQRLNSPMNSPQAMSPYNSPSPSPVVAATMAKTSSSLQTPVPAQPVKGLQYPFPSHPPLVLAPTTPPTTPIATASQNKPKIATATKSFSLQEKPVTQSPIIVAGSNGAASGAVTSSANANRVLCKSASVPGSTNVGTVKTSLPVISPNLLPMTPNAKSDDTADPTTSTNSSRRSSADLSTKSSYTKSTPANSSKKADKVKHNHRNESDTKKSKSEKSRSESIDKRKTSISSEEKDDGSDVHEKDVAACNERLVADDDRLKKVEFSGKEMNERISASALKKAERADRKAEKRREKEEREREERERKAAAEHEQREIEERDRKERERKEREEREQKEREERERRERDERERLEELARKEREECERKEREDRERREREERERRDREEKERREREERERRDREERERREREEQARREREEHLRREREEREKKEREEAAKREREERERKEKEEAIRRDREEHERKEREEAVRREREEAIRREREEREIREEQERREKEERDRREKEERERREKEVDERERREREEKMRRDRDERERNERRERLESHDHDDHVHEKRDRNNRDEVDRKERRDRDDRRAEIKISEQQKESNTKERNDHDTFSKVSENDVHHDHRMKEDDFSQHLRQLQHHKDEKHYHRDNNNESHLLITDEHSMSQTKRRISANSPIRITKRRLSSQDSMETEENPKRMKATNIDVRKPLDRLDSKDSNRSSKHHKSHNRASSVLKGVEEKLLSAEERCRKDSGFEEKKCKDKEHKKYDRSSSHKHKKSSTSVEKEENELRSPGEKAIVFDLNEMRSSDEDHQQRHKNKKEHKEKKRHEHDEEPHRRSSDSKRHDNNRHERKFSSRSEDASQKGSLDKPRSKPPSRKMTQSSNDSDSDEPKKHSIFDILDDGPYVSMYDKVKARSCKNMQKQEEEKKIKAKFSQLKQSRAKREEKKRSTSYDGDSDSDFDDRQAKYKRSSFINSSSDEGSSAMNRIKDTPISDSDSDVRRAQYNRARLNELCDGDSSEGGSILGKTVPCKKISSKRNSRSTRIVSDSSDTESTNRIKAECHDDLQRRDANLNIKQEIKTEDELDRKTKMNRFCPLKTEKEDAASESLYGLKMEIKDEPIDDIYSSHVSESEANICSGSAMESKDSVLDQLFAADVRKKHKKNKKRQKLSSSHASEMDSDKGADIKAEKHGSASMEHVFDELKKDTALPHFSERKKHKDRKEKKREKSREEYEKLSKEERHRLKKAKKSKCTMERYGQEASIPKRNDEKMEDIFGPISDDETQHSMADSVPKDGASMLYENVSSGHTIQPVVSAALNPYKQEPLTPKSHTVEENEENKQKSTSHAERERHRKEKREKKRKERERNREQHALAALQQQKHEDENSVDLDEAGRALEAQLMEDSDNKLTEETTPSTATTHKSDMHDVFRFSDGDENSMEIISQEKKEHSEPHKSKEKKKKKKRSKEERHQKRDHHHHSSSTHSSGLPTSSNKLSIEITTPVDNVEVKSEEICKQSPSLPCLLDESPPRKNNISSDLNLSISPLSREQPAVISPIPKTPTTSSAASKSSDCRKKPDKFIPGFDVELDEKISESAVKSISTELTAPKLEPPVVEDPKLSLENTVESKIDKIEEKSRVIISQEETEDAVAALLGESFGSNTVDYSFADDACDIQPEEDVVVQDPTETIIPEEEAEEMRKAVQSLSTEDIEIKPDTPQSEQDLQIDTDTDDQDEEVQKTEDPQQDSQRDGMKSSNKKADEPNAIAKSNTQTKSASSAALPSAVSTKRETKVEKESEKSKLPEAKVSGQLAKEKPGEVIDVHERSNPKVGLVSTPMRSSKSPVQHQPPSSPSIPALPKSGPTASRPPTHFVMQPPTISIPESAAFVYPLSPRSGDNSRMPSPRHSQQSQQVGTSVGQSTTPTQIVNVRVASPHSPNVRQNQPSGIRAPAQLSPVMPTHMVIQQRQLMSPPNVSLGSQQQAVSSASITLNRIPVTTVLAPMSKPIQQTNILLPQPNTAHASMISRTESATDKEIKTIPSSTAVYQTMRMTPPSPSSSGFPSNMPDIMSANMPGKVRSPTIQIAAQPTIKTVIETQGPGQMPQVLPMQMTQGKVPSHQTVVLQSPPPGANKPPHLQTVHSPRPNQSQPPQPHVVKISQHPQMLQQHHMMQQRQQQMQHAAQIIQMQQKQQQQSKQPSPQTVASHRIVQQQVLQLHPVPSPAQASQPQPIGKDVSHKIAVPVPSQLVQGIVNKDLQQARIQQNVVVVRQPPNVVSQQSPQAATKQTTSQPPTQSQPHAQIQIQHQQSQPIILQQRQTSLSQVSSPIVFQQKLPTSVPNIIHQSAVKVQIPTSQPHEPSSQACQTQVTPPANEELSQQKNIGRTELLSSKGLTEAKEKERKEPTEIPTITRESEAEKPTGLSVSDVKRETPKAEIKSSTPPQIAQSQQQQPDLENVSVIKSQTAATPVQPTKSSVLSEENVSKFSVPIDDQIEQDSKEDWSAKELNLNIESVIKKVDALCSNDEDTSASKALKNSATQVKDAPQNVQPPFEAKETTAEKTADSSTSIVVSEPEKKTDHTDFDSAAETEKNEDTHDEEEFDDVVESGKAGRGGKRGGRSSRGGKKPIGPTAQLTAAPVTVQTSAQNIEGVQTRRGKNTQGARGRKGRAGHSRSPAISAQSPIVTPGEKKARNQPFDQDVYEFHEDSGEESISTKNERQRLILTIKTTNPATPPQQLPQPAPAIAPLNTSPMAQPQPPTTQLAPEATTPPQKENREREEFTTPATNTRKSRRLLEKDGVATVRNTVDDTIEDVVRNLSSSPKIPPGAQTPPRRSTRNSIQVTTPRGAVHPATLEKPANVSDVRKSPRANRRSKDRKISENSVDSSDERGPHLEEKAMTKQSPQQMQEQIAQAQSQGDFHTQSAVQVDGSSAENKLNVETPKKDDIVVTSSKPIVTPPVNKLPEKITGKSKDPAETLALIDPVTGLLTVVQQSKEGQYVPVPGAPPAPPNAKLVGTHVSKVVLPKEDAKRDDVLQQKVADSKQSEVAISAQEANKGANVVVSTSKPQPVGTPPTSHAGPISSPNVSRSQTPITHVAMQQQAQKVQVHVQSAQLAQIVQTQDKQQAPVAQQHQQTQLSTQQPHESKQIKMPQVQLVQPQLPQQHQSQPQTTVSQSALSQPQLQNQTQLQSQPQPIKTHLLKAHMLNSHHNVAMNKPITNQGTVKASGGATSQPATSVVTTIVQSNIVTRHVTTGGVPQPSGINLSQIAQSQSGQPIHNLYVNIPPSSSAVQVAVTHSPRAQQTVVTKPDQNPPSSHQPVQLLHVVTKPIGGGQQQQIIAQHQPMVIHSNKIQPPPTQYAAVVQGGKIIQQVAPMQSGGGRKPQTIQVMQHIPPQGQTSQSTQQQHMQLHQAQKQPPTVSVVTHQLGKQVPHPVQVQQQQHHAQQHSGGVPTHLAQPQQSVQHLAVPPSGGNPGKPPNTIHLVPGQQSGIIMGPQQIVTHVGHQSSHSHQSVGGATILQAKPAHQQQISAAGKGVMGLHQTAQIITGAVSSPPPKQSHIVGQQPVVSGTSNLRAPVPPISPQGQARGHLMQPGLAASAFETNMHDIGGFGAQLSQSPPPAHQQASPITPGEGAFPGGAIRGIPRDHYIMYQQYYRTQPETRIPYIPRSPLVQGSAVDQKDMAEVNDSIGASPPLELRRPGSGPRAVAVPHSLQSPQDRATDSPQVAQVYVHQRIPHPQYQEVTGRYFDPVRQVPAEPPPAHRPAHSVVGVAPSPSNYAPQQPQGPPAAAALTHIHPKMLGREREREQREREQREREQRENEARYYADDKRMQRKQETERTSIPPGHTGMPSHDSIVPALPTPTGRSLQVATPPHANQVPPQGDSLLTLLQRYPLMWQGLLALKTDQAAVQMHFVFGNPLVARGSLPHNSDGSTPPLRIAQRMRLEQTQLEGVAKKMQYENEHCMLLALPCGRNHMDVLQQSRNLQTGFITYLQQKMAAGIVNIPVPGSDQAAYVVHIFPSCDFANENLERAAPDLKHRLAEIAHLLIIIATV